MGLHSLKESHACDVMTHATEISPAMIQPLVGRYFTTRRARVGAAICVCRYALCEVRACNLSRRDLSPTTLQHYTPTKEAAFTYAITSAGVTHALSAACARGDLPACQCTSNRRRGTSTSEQFEWGGCGEGAYGARLARRFLDARELERDARALMNLHNNRVGRKIVKELVRRECKCHGVSGSCAVRTCWRALPQQKQNPGVVRVPRKSDLVFLEPSPSYCERDDAVGSFGTHLRVCNRTSRGPDGCESLCCGRGYSTVRRVQASKCRCRFHWCCRVSCDTCVATTHTHLCN
ncbi:hypothetical protein HW555_007903 [Spodoptera exigua]|uniref:Protein Wnt n=1 Tax=Spodoptera exigua TaxID=7107 RepID=A0A835GF88_SPOEX|nr:hypothetical protein HW555_007903 [Spodoptera exigua]